MMGMPTCREVTARLTDFDEGALGPFAWAGIRLHLGLCPPCRAFLASLRRSRSLVAGLLGEDPTPAPAAEQALNGALALLRQGRLPQGPRFHPDADRWSADDDPLAALLRRVHLGWCGACRAQHPGEAPLEPGGGALPDSLRAALPPESDWIPFRRGLGGATVARIHQDPARGSALYLVRLPAGGRFPRHAHAGAEAAVLLAGRLQDGPADLHAGDWIFHGPDSQHAPEAEPGEDCLALVHLEGSIRFTGWRRLLV